jgi:peptidoglycan/xylan/chitin deacetylase (PgdA/CDA1 family)
MTDEQCKRKGKDGKLYFLYGSPAIHVFDRAFLERESMKPMPLHLAHKKIAYLTFDDGPYYSTHDFLKVLNKYKVKATFFTIGLDKEKCFDNRSKKCHELYKKVVDQGHTIANHSYSHLIFNGLYSSSTALINQVKKQETFIKDKTGATTNIFRFPGGSGTAKAYGVFDSAVKKLREMNYGWIDWSASNGDGGDPGSKSKALARFKDEINENIEVVLFHDYSWVTLSMLPEAIEYLQKNNYVILPLFYESVKVNK